MKRYLILGILSITIFFQACKEPEQSEQEIIIDWIWDTMNEIYLWTGEIDQSLYPTNQTDPENFFYSILYSEDKFSWIVDDYQTLINSFNNIELSSGISPYFIRISNSNDVAVIVEYVERDSPAEKAGVKRGDIITEINNTILTTDNYAELFYSEDLILKFASYSEGALFPNNREITIKAEVIETNPIHFSEIMEYEGRQIAYIVYTGFSAGNQDKWIDSLDALLYDYKNQGIKDLILDIRYNPGGSVFVAQHLASALAPSNVPDGKNILINFEWNDSYQNYFLREEGQNSGNLIIPFEDYPSINLDLENIYFLTSSHSASASELIIIGLEPYMNVIHIGEPTYGKCYGSVTLKDTENPIRHNWAMQPIAFKYKNSLGYTDFTNGLTPDFEIEDNILEALPFGDQNDPILAKALEEITGVSPIEKKAIKQSILYETLKDPIRESKSRAGFEIRKN